MKIRAGDMNEYYSALMKSQIVLEKNRDKLSAFFLLIGFLAQLVRASGS